MIVDFHPQESWYYEAYGADGCYKGVTKGGKVGDHCQKCKGPIRSITIRYFLLLPKMYMNYIHLI